MLVTINELLTYNLEGKVIIFETDTVYGIGCLYNDLPAIKRIYEIKNREYHKPMAILCANFNQVKKLVNNYYVMTDLGKKYWPGALTLIGEKSNLVADLITSGGPTVGVRIPDNELALKILSHFGPMVVTSLNQSHEPAILLYRDALKYEAIVDYIVVGHDLSQLASTVYDPALKKTIRQGSIVVSLD
ncbi:MAG: L-threonylcarbamoyladenylate synthase [Candidatus Izemoplasmatales bacterium]|jgi:L-threonylcarbamoyladenylate synthase